MMYSLVLLVSVFTGYQGVDVGQNIRWKASFTALDACLPPDKKEEVEAEVGNQISGVRVEVASPCLGKPLSFMPKVLHGNNLTETSARVRSAALFG
jgi:hypothetical protein